MALKDGPVGARDWSQLAKQRDLVRRQSQCCWHLERCTMDHREPEDAQAQYAEQHNQVAQTLSGTKALVPGAAARFHCVEKSFDFPTNRVPVELLDSRSAYSARRRRCISAIVEDFGGIRANDFLNTNASAACILCAGTCVPQHPGPSLSCRAPPQFGHCRAARRTRSCRAGSRPVDRWSRQCACA